MKKELSSKQRDELLAALKARFDANLARHPGLVWAKVQARLEAKPDKLWSLAEMERTGGEPDVVGVKSGAVIFFDCAPESPAGRRSVGYNRQKLDIVNKTRSNLFGWRGQFPTRSESKSTRVKSVERGRWSFATRCSRFTHGRSSRLPSASGSSRR